MSSPHYRANSCGVVGYSYAYFYDGVGLAIWDRDGADVAFLQGDAAVELWHRLLNMEDAAFPLGPYGTYEDWLDDALMEYDFRRENA